jgi:transposase
VVQQLISEKMPDQLKLSFALWTRAAVQELIYRRIKVDMPIRTVGEYLKRVGFTPQEATERRRTSSENLNWWMPGSRRATQALAQRAQGRRGRDSLGR